MGFFKRKRKAPPIPSQEHVNETLQKAQERIAEAKFCPRCSVSFAGYASQEFNGTEYCCLCAAEYNYRFDLKDGQLMEKKTGQPLLKEVTICKRPLSSCCGETAPTDFIFWCFPDRIEIQWGVGWRGGYSHADGAGGTETLPGDFFRNNTMDDLIAFLETKPWAEDFLNWFDLRNNQKLNDLFDDPLPDDLRNKRSSLVDLLLQQIDPDRKAVTLFLVDRGDPSRYHETIALQRNDGAWLLVEDYLTPEFDYQNTAFLPEVTDNNVKEWLTGFITDHPEEILLQRACPASGLYHGECYTGR